MMLWQDETPADRIQAAWAALRVTAVFREPVSTADEQFIQDMIERADAASVWHDTIRELRIVRTFAHGREWT